MAIPKIMPCFFAIYLLVSDLIVMYVLEPMEKAATPGCYNDRVYPPLTESNRNQKCYFGKA